MNAKDVIAGLPYLQAAAQGNEQPPGVVVVPQGWNHILHVSNPGFRDWIIWHHQVLIHGARCDAAKEARQDQSADDDAGRSSGALP